MSTALREPLQGLRMGRLVKVIARPPKTTACPKRAEPPAPRSEEVRLLIFFGVGGAACLAVLALAGILLLAGAANNPDPVAELTPQPLVASAPSLENRELEEGEILPEPALDPPEVEILPQPVEASLQMPALALLATEPAARPDKDLIPQSSEPVLNVDKPRPKPACEKFGTKIQFMQNPLDAFRKAREENKQVFFVHLSGNFEDQAFT